MGPAAALLLGSVAPAAIEAGASIFGNILGSRNTSKTNATNLRIARETNDFNAQQAQVNREWQEMMWNKSNEYNSPVNQAKLAAQAGLNPLAYVEGSDFAPAASSLGGSQAQAAGVPQMQAFHPDFSGIGHAAASIFSNMSEKSRADILRTQADFQLFHEQNQVYKDIAEIEAKRVMTDTDRERLKMLKTQAYIMSKTVNAQINQINSESNRASAMAAMADGEFFEQTISRNIRMATLEKGYNLSNAQIAKLSYEMRLLKEQAVTQHMTQKQIDAEIHRIARETRLTNQRINMGKPLEGSALYRYGQQFDDSGDVVSGRKNPNINPLNSDRLYYDLKQVYDDWNPLQGLFK